MIKTCPKCGKEGRFGFLGQPDHTGVIAMFTHKTGVYTDGIFGPIEEKTRCMITSEELTSLPWYPEWKIKYDTAQEKLSKELQEEMEKDYRSYINENR